MEIAAAHTHSGDRDHDSAAIYQAGASLTATLARCASGFGGSSQLARPLHDASHLLSLVESAGRRHEHPIPMHLSAAATAWGAADDLLATHFAPRRTHARSDWSSVISDQHVRDQLLKDVADTALMLSAILRRTRPIHILGIQAVPHLLASPAIIEASQLDGSAALGAVPLNQLAQPLATPHLPQSPDELCQGIISGTDALRSLSYQYLENGPSEWPRTALAATITTHIGARLLNQLTRRAYELNSDRRHDLSMLLQHATDGFEQAHAAWKGVRHAWHRHLSPGRFASSVRQQHLEQVIVRLGRLLHTNPLWTPVPQHASPIRKPAEIAQNTSHMVPMLRSLLHASEALGTIAEQDRTGALRAIMRGGLSRGDTELLRIAYLDLAAPTARTSWALSEAIFLSSDSEQRLQLWPEIHSMQLRRPPTTREIVRERPKTERWLDWTATRSAVSDARFGLPATPTMPSRLSGPAQTSGPKEHRKTR
ncbi:hypothetical protein ACFFHJ_16925 [Planotetraspora thailandica]|nr:hypothetical protein [Planotetraspora thailandica]